MTTRSIGMAWVGVLALAASAAGQRARPSPQVVASPQITPTPQEPRPVVPPGLPRYDLAVRLDPAARKVTARERVVFTNRSRKPVRELVFHVYPRYKVPEGDKLVLSKTLEMLRLSPEEAMDVDGRRLAVTATRVDGKPATYQFDRDVDTILILPLPRPLPPGRAVTAEVDFTLDLPDKWGRWGRHAGVTFLANWYPTLAHHDDQGWERTPFVPWHQPWHQEAGHYRVRIDLPADQVVASTGSIVTREVLGPRGRDRALRRAAVADPDIHPVEKPQPDGAWQRLTIVASPARDFALTCSDRFRAWEKQAGSTRLRVVAFADEEDNAEAVLKYAADVIPTYEHWFGPCPVDEMEYTVAYFGWNGNECSGLVWLDDRVMRLPWAGRRYIDHLVTHETCHQWWWNCVGSDGYAETFMDEGLVNGFTAMSLDEAYGRNGPLIVWPRGLSWLPTIGREDLRLAGYYGWRARGNSGPVVQDLGKMGNLNTLFSLAYDRGGKVVEMIRNRLGKERFFAFWRQMYVKYSWKTFHYADLRRELAAFDPGGHWPEFLDGWIDGHAETDWAVERVEVGAPKADSEVRPVSVELRQDGRMEEPTVVLCRGADAEVRVPIWPDRGDYDVPGARVEKRGKNRWLIRLDAPGRPTQVEVDPDHALLDAKPDNNRWKPEVAVRFTPLMTPLDESSQFQAYDRVSIVAGPFVDQYARGGFKTAIQRLDRWQVTGWAGTEPALREAIFGGQATLFHFPAEKWSAGFFYEEGLYNFYNDRRHSGGRAFLRYRFLETSSFLVDDPGFFEFYYGLGNEFWAGDDGRPVNTYLGAVGARYRLSTLSPYWDPVQGFLFEASAEYGNALLGSKLDYARATAEYGIVRPLPEGLGYLSSTRVALRAYGGYGSPNDATLFRLGGGRRLRALDLTTFEGHAVWLGTVEWRLPVWRDADVEALDRTLRLRNLLGAVFYDVGQSFLANRNFPVVHSVGVGLRLDTSLFSFLERANIRIDIAQPLGIGTRLGPVIWFGLNQVF